MNRDRSVLAFLMLLSGSLWMLIPSEALAWKYIGVNCGFKTCFYHIQCNDGHRFSVQGTKSQAETKAKDECSSHGGLADVSDEDILDALDYNGESCVLSSVTLAKDLGGGQFDELTYDEFMDMFDGQPPGTSIALTGYEMLGLVVNGTPLLTPPPGLAAISISEVVSNDDDSGDAVGGATSDCDAPIPRTATAAIAVLLGGIGAQSLRWRRRTRSGRPCREPDPPPDRRTSKER